MRCTLAVLLWIVASLATEGRASAQDPTAGAEPLRQQLTVQIDPTIPEADRAPIREAIGREIGATLLDAPTPGVSTLIITRTPDGSVALTLHESAAPVTRALPWSDEPGAAARDIALMAQNLVLDQTRGLLEAEEQPATPSPLPNTVPNPPVAAADSERPPDFVPRPPPPPPPPPIRNRARLHLLGLIAPSSGLPLTVNGEDYDNITAAHGVLGRFDLPLTERLSAGGGIAVAKWDSSEHPRAGREVSVGIHGVMDATAWLRGFVPFGPRIEAYALAGAGPSTFTYIHVTDRSLSNRTARPYVGLNASLTVGSSVRLLNELGAALELSAQYHFVHGRQAEGARMRIHAVHIALLVGAVWSFDGR